MNCCNHDNDTKDVNEVSEKAKTPHNHKRHKHGLFMMLLCLIPMGIIIIGPILNKTEGPKTNPLTFLFVLLCPLMHIFMMVGMSKKHNQNK